MKRPLLRELAAVFLRYGNLTIGGGSATTVVLQVELIERRGWLSREAFAVCFGAARLTPGTNLLSLEAGIGWLMRGAGGAAVAMHGGSIPAPCSPF